MAGPWVLEMGWKHLCFCHWPIPEPLLRPHMPQGWEVDLYQGEAWVSVVPFALENVHVRGLPAIAGYRNVPELNLRTYVRRGNVRAVFFFSLDASSRAVVYAARVATGLPYRYADMSLSLEDETVIYRSTRRNSGITPGEFAAEYRAVGEEQTATPGSIEEFLHERYYFVTRRGIVGQVIHQPYRTRAAEITIRRNTLATTIPYVLPNEPALCYYVDGLTVRAAYGGPTS